MTEVSERFNDDTWKIGTGSGMKKVAQDTADEVPTRGSNPLLCHKLSV